MPPATPGTRIRYMGNKVGLAADVAEVLEAIQAKRPLVDLFGGMCSVAGAASRSGRRVWVNDAQRYAGLAAKCLLTSQTDPPGTDKVVAELVPGYRANLSALRERFSTELETEACALARGSRVAYQEAYGDWKHAANDDRVAGEVARLSRGDLPYRLATLTFAWGYFGLRQSIELDSIYAAVDRAALEGRIDADEAAWCRFALVQTCSLITSGPGHFAQYLRGDTETSLERILRARRKSVWAHWLEALKNCSPYGTKRWRARNRVSTEDALQVWQTLDAAKLGRAVFYADPPYSKEHYSRFYHVLETLERYDYPSSTGSGRYRPDRFTSAFATKRGVLDATRSLCAAIAERDGVLLLSYPSSGLLNDKVGVDIGALLSEYFEQVDLVIDKPSAHSTMGARHGQAKQLVTEFVWRAQ